MKVIAALSIVLALTGAASAFELNVISDLARIKAGKVLKARDVKALMGASTLWCYRPEGTTCQWTDHYDAATPDQVDISNAWDADTTVTVTETLNFEGDRVCTIGIDRVETLSAMREGTPLEGKPLNKLRDVVRQSLEPEAEIEYCFDYRLDSVSRADNTATLIQRQYDDGTYAGPETDTPVVLYFEPGSADALTTRL